MDPSWTSMTPRRGRVRERQSRRRVLTRRILYPLIGILGLLGLAVLLLRGYGPYYLNLSPGTDSGGLVSILTNHSRYRVTESMHITVRNRMHTPIYTVYFPDYDCSIYLESEGLYAGQWRPDESFGANCPNPTSGCCAGCRKPVPHPNEVRQINPGTAYVQSWHPGGFGTLAHAGPHRILFVYSTDQQTISQQAMRPGLEPVDVPDAPSIQVATSATLHLEDDGYRPRTPVPCE